MVSILQVIIDALMFTIAFTITFICFMAIHEGLHIFVIKDILKKEYHYKIKKKFGIPIMFFVHSNYFNKPYHKMDKKKQWHYFLCAIAPYMFLYPYFYYWTQIDVYIIWVIGFAMCIGQLANLPLEFIYVTEVKQLKKKSKLKKSVSGLKKYLQSY